MNPISNDKNAPFDMAHAARNYREALAGLTHCAGMQAEAVLQHAAGIQAIADSLRGLALNVREDLIAIRLQLEGIAESLRWVETAEAEAIAKASDVSLPPRE